MEPTAPSLPLGSDGRVQAAALANATGARALLVRDADGPRVLLTVDETVPTDRRAGVVVTPLDDEVAIATDRDALAAWLARDSVGEAAMQAGEAATRSVPGWASGLGLVLLLAIVALTVLGSLTFFGWLFRALGIVGS